MFEEKFKAVLHFLDKYYFVYKQTKTGFNYVGLVFDEMLENCVFCIDYLNIEDYFNTIAHIKYHETQKLSEQYSSLSDDEYAKLFSGIISLIHQQKDEQSSNIITRILNFFDRNNIYYKLDGEYYTFHFVKIVGSGSYADVIYVSNTVLKKRLNKASINDINQQKRFRYEFENMKKLADVDNVLKVYDYNENEHSYFMEKCDCCLYDYLISKILTKDRVNDLILQVLNSVKEIHLRNIIHRDIHLGNFLVKNDKIIIADFGLSKDLNIERSLTSSDTPKNNNSFVDPIGLKNFSKLDKLSDIYSVGKVIEFIISNNPELLVLYSSIIEKCVERRRQLRYQSIEEVIHDVKYILDEDAQKRDHQQIIDGIVHGRFDVKIKKTILKLTEDNSIASFIVKNRLFKFGEVLLNFDFVDQEKITQNILKNYVDATGYCGWDNYDIFTSIALCMIEYSSVVKIKKSYYLLLKEIATNYRWNAINKLNYINNKYPDLKDS